jgi:uncharacterized membrane protein YeaQ/YmgE (transglycosylase-associated protein family)
MINWSYVMKTICALRAAAITNFPAKAGSFPSIPSGIYGAVAAAIIMNQFRLRAGGHASRGRVVARSKSHSSSESSGKIARSKDHPSSEAANPKDPFAGASPPAGYAKPVNSN